MGDAGLSLINPIGRCGGQHGRRGRVDLRVGFEVGAEGLRETGKSRPGNPL